MDSCRKIARTKSTLMLTSKPPTTKSEGPWLNTATVIAIATIISIVASGLSLEVVGNNDDFDEEPKIFPNPEEELSDPSHEIVWDEHGNLTDKENKELEWTFKEFHNFHEDPINKIDKVRAGVLVGTGMGGLTIFNGGVQALIEKEH